ncbi:hypothetical protein BXT86_01220 [candidate division WOR-3 bacterium 4484_100]|uniref:aspartate kinase n=1 Tax=candidate division WOR-3 bacterium 4484_100 TaxID=1936077 RepID=A0A1V4QHG3_UNCW3|nr:MAG: hypothetical protein BXT86_01220 [candidate division WOR-3 bacterium 4484_100]
MEKLIERVEYNTKVSKVTLKKVVDQPGVAAEIFALLGKHGLNIELISSCSAGQKRTDVSLAVLDSDVDEVVKILEAFCKKFGVEDIYVDKDVGMVSIFGENLSRQPNVASRIFRIISDKGVNIEMINASMLVMNIVIDEKRIMDVVASLRAEFLI